AIVRVVRVLSDGCAFAGDEGRVALEGGVIEVSGDGMRMGKAYLPPLRPGSDCSPGRHLSVSPGQGGRFRQEGALPGCTHVRRVSCRKRGAEVHPEPPRRRPRTGPKPDSGAGPGRDGTASGDAAAQPAAKIFCTAMSTPVRLSPAITPAATTMRNAALHFGATFRATTARTAPRNMEIEFQAGTMKARPMLAGLGTKRRARSGSSFSSSASTTPRTPATSSAIWVP